MVVGQLIEMEGGFRRKRRSSVSFKRREICIVPRYNQVAKVGLSQRPPISAVDQSGTRDSANIDVDRAKGKV